MCQSLSTKKLPKSGRRVLAMSWIVRDMRWCRTRFMSQLLALLQLCDRSRRLLTNMSWWIFWKWVQCTNYDDFSFFLLLLLLLVPKNMSKWQMMLNVCPHSFPCSRHFSMSTNSARKKVYGWGWAYDFISLFFLIYKKWHWSKSTSSSK